MVTYRARPIRRARRTKAEIEVIRSAIYHFAEEQKPVSVRQVFYNLTVKGLVEKTEKECKGTVGRLMTDMRKNGDLPYDWVTDATRWMHRPSIHSDLATMLDEQKDFYRRDLWRDQDTYVEIWLEKEALVGVIYDVTAEWGVPLMPTRGYPSLSFLWNASQTMREAVDAGKNVVLYYFGDHDPAGVDIPRSVEEGIIEVSKPHKHISVESIFFSVFDGLFGQGGESTSAGDLEGDDTITSLAGLFDFEVVAVTPEQIREWDLPSRPTKRNTNDHRARNFKGDSTELDAIPPNTFRQLVRHCIEQHIDKDALKRTQRIEKAERRTLEKVLETLPPRMGGKRKVATNKKGKP